MSIVPSIAQMEISPYKDTIPPPERAVGAAPPALLRVIRDTQKGRGLFSPCPGALPRHFCNYPFLQLMVISVIRRKFRDFFQKLLTSARESAIMWGVGEQCGIAKR